MSTKLSYNFLQDDKAFLRHLDKINLYDNDHDYFYIELFGAIFSVLRNSSRAEQSLW
ncbi:MAG: hypothetical protein ACPGJV_06820 [Bacteriovoracaceae bacterium]